MNAVVRMSHAEIRYELQKKYPHVVSLRNVKRPELYDQSAMDVITLWLEEQTASGDAVSDADTLVFDDKYWLFDDSKLWTVWQWTWYFKNLEDAVAFKLRWH